MQHEQNPYDFILNSGQDVKAARTPGSNSMLGRIIIAVVGVGVLIAVIAVGYSYLTDDGGASEAYLKTAQTQNETVRVAKSIAKDATDQATKNLSLSIQLTATTQRNKFTETLAANNISFDKKLLQLGKNSKTDQRLETAKSGGLFDVTAMQILEEQLEAYQTDLNAAYQLTASKTLKEQLSADYEANKLLLSRLRLEAE